MDGKRRGDGSRGGRPLPIETCPAVLRLPQSSHHPYVSEQVLATSCRALLLSTQVMNTGILLSPYRELRLLWYIASREKGALTAMISIPQARPKRRASVSALLTPISASQKFCLKIFFSSTVSWSQKTSLTPR